ncbi:MAG: hypothetical protein KF760_22965 [Candidatus Eremiobacteraeota bacterium]|nr:hypothetical protein [Candidatus Eremiobacteraeota bacterium]MCW5868373.1 hypothetical protein [Candidatus Eremiobacteraeota bacterium]
MSQSSFMRDVRGYRAYRRLKLGWKLLSLALLGLGVAPMLQGFAPSALVGHALLLSSLGVAVWGSLLTATGPLHGSFRWICLFVSCNCVLLAVCEGQNAWGGLPWLTLLLALLAGDRGLRREMGLAKGINLVPPGCLLGLLVAPFFWPLVMVLGPLFLFIYLVFAYTYVAGALPRPQDLAEQLEGPVEQAMGALTRI